MKYNVGDKVRIKSIDWYNENKDNYGAIYSGNGFCFWKNMARHCGEIMKIAVVKVDPEDSNKGYYFMENSEERWTDGMIEGLVEETSQNAKLVSERFSEYVNPSEFKYAQDTITKMLLQGANIPDGYVLKDENDNEILTSKIILEKKKKEYPKTYEECAILLGLGVLNELKNNSHSILYKKDLIISFHKLLICRDAYWKIASTDMGLGKPWEPDWEECNHPSHCIFVGLGNFKHLSHILAFPTPEMRDAFKENFGPDIEICKELL